MNSSSVTIPENVLILVVDDEASIAKMISQSLSQIGFISYSAGNAYEALAMMVEHPFDVVITDVRMPGMDGVDLLKRIKAEYDSDVIVMTGYTEDYDYESIITAGASDFVYKPVSFKELIIRLKRVLHLRYLMIERDRMKDQLEAENIYLHHEVARKYNFGEIIGQNNALSNVCLQVEQVAPMNATVLLLGETGTGKGVLAGEIHRSSSRKDRTMITVDCTALPSNLIESELFGREKGAFTGADARQIGRFELADGSTIFLDEIGDMPLELQSKLLRIIQDGEFERLGNPRTIKIDVRIIAATNRDLEEEIRNGNFREDLFYRLNVFPITIPPLRQRKEDIPLLVNHFVAKFNKKIGKKIETLPKDALNILQEYHWPGNVRELESVIERAVIISQGTSLQITDMFNSFRKADKPAGQDVKTLADLEYDHILQVLQKTDWQIEGEKGAAVLLGLHPSTLRARMRKYGISRQ